MKNHYGHPDGEEENRETETKMENGIMDDLRNHELGTQLDDAGLDHNLSLIHI